MKDRKYKAHKNNGCENFCALYTVYQTTYFSTVLFGKKAHNCYYKAEEQEYVL